MTKLFNLTLSTRKSYGISFIAGCLLALAFAPIHFFLLAIICPALLLYFYLTSHSTIKIIIHAFCFAFGLFLVGVSWVYVAMHDFGNFNLLLSVILTLLFCLAMAIVFLMQAIIMLFFRRTHYICQALLVFPASWVIYEWIRSWLFTGFTWLQLGFSQSDSLLANYYPLIGSYGVTFLLTFSAGLLVIAVVKKNIPRYLAILVLLLIWLGGFGLYFVHWTKPANKPTSVNLVQGNIPQSMKWQPETLPSTLAIYKKLTASHWRRLVVWPEAAIPTIEQAIPHFIDDLSTQAKQHDSTVVTGIIRVEQSKIFNSAIALGQNSGKYDKRHIVPFGEYTPKLFSMFTKFLDLPKYNLSSGKDHQTLIEIDHNPIAILICYEIAYSHLFKIMLPQARLLINISNDGWFGRSFASAQQLQMAQVAASQTGRYLLSVGNNGITAIVDPKGRIIKQVPRFTRTALTGTISFMTGSTPWVIIGDWPIILLMFILLGVAVIISLFYRPSPLRPFDRLRASRLRDRKP
ncbi:MAG: apolipoprotein N-acyltransferase [Pseudomonadota bacterium]